MKAVVVKRAQDRCQLTIHRLLHPCSELTAIVNLDRGASGAGTRSDAFHGADDVHSLDDRPKDDVLAVQPRRLGSAQEELRAICVGTGCGEKQKCETDGRVVCMSEERLLENVPLAMERMPGPVCLRLKFCER